MPLVAIELLCLAIVASFVVVRARLGLDRRGFFATFAWLAVAAALGEATCIHWYGFYGYAPGWKLWLGPVPLLVVLIWPCVVLSAWDLARHLTPTRAWLGAGLLVLADASLIEPVSVAAGLWTWTAPGLFAVPPVGVLGWALFAAAGALVLQRGSQWWQRALIVPATFAGVHLGLLAAWWGLLRWVSVPIPTWPAVALLWLASVVATLWSLRHGAGARVPRWVMGVRVAPSVFFLALLVRYGREPELWAWALAFVPPYLSLLVGHGREHRR